MKPYLYAAILLGIVGSYETPAYGQTRDSYDALFRRLQSDQISQSGDAFERFLKLGKKRADVREYLAARLPEKIAMGPGDHIKVWDYEVGLAGNLKIVETIPALIRHIDQLIPLDFVTLGSKENLGDFPAGASLAQIGEPAVPALFSVLETGDYQKRWVASRALNMINAAAAPDALNNHLQHESDPRLKDFIENVVRLRRAGLPH